LEGRFWGIEPAPYHIVNLLWHALNAALLWRVLARLKVPGAWLAAALFALHPVNVESVAWVTEQKNTQAMFFFLGAVWCYLRFEDTGRRRWYWLATGAFALALAAKSAVVVLPVVLLGLAWWRRGRITRVDVMRSICFFILAALAVAVALPLQSQRAADDLGALEAGPGFRVARAAGEVWFYLFKDVLPLNLVSIYPKWSIHAAEPLSYLPAVLLVGLFALLWRFRQSWGKPLLFALGYFVLMLLPVLGLFEISLSRYSWVADHWQYFAIIGPIALLASALQAMQQKNALAGIALAGLILTVCGLLTWRQSGIYKSGEAFWAEHMRVNQPAFAAYNAGCDLLAHGKPDEAMKLLRRAIELQPAFALPYNTIASMLLQKGLPDEALPLLQEAISLRRDFPEAHYNLGTILLAKGRTAEALEHFQRSADLQPKDAAAQYNFGKILLQVGLPQSALVYLQKSVSLRPDFAEAQHELGNALEMSGRDAEAVAHYQKALELRPNFVQACNNLAWILATASDASLRNGPKAVELAQRANTLSGGQNSVILGTLAAAYAQAGQFGEAVKTIEKALPLAAADAGRTAALKTQEAQYKAGQPFQQSRRP
jgi:tetratricopeptide (TPR) repeat protein